MPYSDIFSHLVAYLEPCVTLTYSEPCVTLTYSEPCVTLTYSEPCHTQNPGIFRT